MLFRSQTKYVTEINVREIILLGGRGGGGGADFDGPPAPRGKSADKPKGCDFEEFPNALEAGDDDLPF